MHAVCGRSGWKKISRWRLKQSRSKRDQVRGIQIDCTTRSFSFAYSSNDLARIRGIIKELVGAVRGCGTSRFVVTWPLEASHKGSSAGRPQVKRLFQFRSFGSFSPLSFDQSAGQRRVAREWNTEVASGWTGDRSILSIPLPHGLRARYRN